MRARDLLTIVWAGPLLGCQAGADAPERSAPKPLFAENAQNAESPGKGSLQTKLSFASGEEATGIRFQHVPMRTEERYIPEIMGSGVVIADFNRDGAPDVLLINSGNMLSEHRPADAPNRLFFNDGKGHFTDRSAEWSLPSTGYGMGAAAGDIDNDGWIDLYLTHYGGRERLLRNTGSGFRDVTEGSGLDPDDRWSTSAGFFDLEQDGDLDLYVCRYIDYTPKNAVKCYLNQVHHYCSPHLYDAVFDRLYRNDGEGNFSDISAAAGLHTFAGKGLGVVLSDIDWDGDVDVYVANDVTRNEFYINEGNGKLRENGLLSGVGYSESGRALAGMGVDVSDFNKDDRFDIVVTNFQGEPNTIYQQGEGLFFREVSDAVGVGETSRANLGFGVDFFDADNDGDEDILVANGHIDDNISLQSASVEFAQRNSLYENTGDGHFSDVTSLAGPALQVKQVSRGLATSDLDGDGDLDYIVTNNGGTAEVGLNVSKDPGNFVSLWLEGQKSNRSAIGTRMVARIGELTLKRQVVGSNSYLSVCDRRVHFGLGAGESIDELTILWPNSEPQVIQNLKSGQFYHIVEGQEPESYVPGERQHPIL